MPHEPRDSGWLFAVDGFERERARRALMERLFGVTPEPLRLGRFEITGKIGAGGEAIVYAAFDPAVQRRVAIKRLTRDGSSQERVLAEARKVAQVRHPNVVAVFDISETGPHAFIVSELVQGGTLREWMRAEHSFAQRMQMALAIGAGVRAAHAAGLVHRDLKPDNILVEGNVPKVTDFGVAASHRNPLDASAHATGTPAYMSPEQARGEAPSPRNDQYSFAVLAGELLFGVHPELVRHGSLSASLSPDARRSSGHGPVVDVLERALHPEEARRWLDMGEMLDALGAQSPGGDAPRRRASRSWRFASAALLLGFALALLVGLWQRDVGVAAADARKRSVDLPAPQAAPRDTTALDLASASMLRGDFAGCITLLERADSSALERSTWAACADYGNDVEALVRACSAAEADDPALRNVFCAPRYLRARQLEARGDARGCAESLLEGTPVALWNPTLARCISTVDDDDLHLRYCVRQATHDGTPGAAQGCETLLRLR